MKAKSFFYVSCIDGDRYSLLLGPFPLKREAEKHVESAQRIARKVDPKSFFYSFGVCKTREYNKPGMLTKYVKYLYYRG